MATTYKIVKVITNNLLRAKDINDQDVILSGKGIGFKRFSNDIISDEKVENKYVLFDEKNSNLYDQLIKTTSPRILELSNTIISMIESEIQKDLNEHIHIALTDHICFIVRRYKMGIPIFSPFDYELPIMYPQETAIAEKVIGYLNKELDIDLPKDEVFFITLHIISSASGQTIYNIQKNKFLILDLINVIERGLEQKIDHNSLNYSRLCTHIRFLIERAEKGESISMPYEIMDTIKTNYAKCYSLSWKLSKIIERNIDKKIDDAEVVCLSLHLLRFVA